LKKKISTTNFLVRAKSLDPMEDGECFRSAGRQSIFQQFNVSQTIISQRKS
jgi:hypothetical protein